MKRHLYRIRLILLCVMLCCPLSANALEKPYVLYTDIIAGPNTGGENNNGAYLSIFGKNFGSAITNVKVFVGTGEVARYMYLGASRGRPDIQQLSVQLGQAVTTGSIRVVVGGLESNTDHGFTVSAGEIYFMSLDGSDATGDGSFTKPYRTASKIMQNVPAFGAGDFLVIRGGTYDLSSGSEGLTYSNRRWMDIWRSGTSASQQVTIMGYPGESPVIDWGTFTDYYPIGIHVNGPRRFITICGFKMDLKNSGALATRLGWYSAANEYFDDGRFINMEVTGGMRGPQACSYDANLQPTPDCPGGYGGVNLLSTSRVTRTKFLGNNIHHPNGLSGCGSHVVYMSHFYEEAEIGWNYIHDVPYARATVQLAGDGYGPKPYSVENGTWGANSNVRIHDNYFKNLGKEALLFNYGSFGPIFIYNNVLENINTKMMDGFSSIALRGALPIGIAGKYYLYNNTIATETPRGGMLQLGFMDNMQPEEIALKNNILYAKTKESSYTMTASGMANRIVSSNNLWYGSSSPKSPWASSSEVSADPEFLDPANGNFNLKSTSPAIEKGTTEIRIGIRRDFDGVLRGVTPDIGAYEYKGSGSTLGPPVIHEVK